MVIKSNEAATFQKILLKLNLKITGCIMNGKRYGWMFFFSMTEDLKQLRKLDRLVASSWKRYNLSNHGKPKSFIKTYHDIKFNVAGTKYIPKFDEYSTVQKMQLISDLDGIELAQLQNWTLEEVNKAFKRLLKRELSELEKDITPFS